MSFNWRRPENSSRIAVAISLLISSTFLLLSWRINQHRYFNPDELQHLHYVWCVKHDLTMYRDFLSQHGPIYPYGAALFWKILNFPESSRAMLVFRGASYAGLLAMLALSFLIAHGLSGSLATGCFTVMFLLTHIMFIEKAIEIRPDGIQSILWLGGVYLLLVKDLSSRKKYPIILGILWGLTFVSNFKTIIVLALAGLAYSLVYLSASLWRQLILVSGGFGLAFGTVGVCFLTRGAFREFFYYNGPFNFLTLKVQSSISAWMAPAFFSNYATWGLFAGGLMALFHTSRHRDRLFVYLSLLIGATSLINFYAQWYLLVLPFIAIGAAVGLERLLRTAPTNRFLWVLLVGIFSYQTYLQFGGYFSGKFRTNVLQRETTDFVMKITAPDDRVMVVWNSIGGYQFRPHGAFFWYRTDIFLDARTARAYGYGDEILTGMYKVILAGKTDIGALSTAANTYIFKHYQEQRRYPGVWLRQSLGDEEDSGSAKTHNEAESSQLPSGIRGENETSTD